MIYSPLTETHFSCVLLFPDTCNGRDFNYKFIINGATWVVSRTYPIVREGGNENNVMKVATNATTLVPAGLYETIEVPRKYFNYLHQKLGIEGYDEIYVSMESEDVMVIIRQNPRTMDSYFLIARSYFKAQAGPESLRGIKLPGVVEQVELIAQLNIKDWKFIEDRHEVNGLKGALEIFGHLGKFASISAVQHENVDMVTFHNIPAGFVCVIRTRLSAQGASALSQLHTCYSAFTSVEELKHTMDGMTLAQVNYALWKCGAEEKDWTDQRRDVYEVPGFGSFMYAGLGALAIEFKRMGVFNQLGHSIFNNIRDGDWLINYHCERLSSPYLPENFSAFCLSALNNIKLIPRGSIPKHIVKFALGVFRMVRYYVLGELFKGSGDLAANEDAFVETLAFATTQFFGDVKSAKTAVMNETMAAGLPHFSVGFMRCWGRDTFISFKGMFLRTARFTEAADIIATYAGTMQHGLIPNLLDCGLRCRYNARDATWWFLQAVKDFLLMAPDGHQLLSRTIKMQFFKGEHEQMTLAEVIQSILQAHAVGIAFREWNAGPQIDAHMKSAGFDVEVRLDPNTGFIFGGNQWNCGTWMDKLGSSEKARNRGTPATPRDGADIEIVALSFSVLSFLASEARRGLYPFAEVRLPNRSMLSLEEWAGRIHTAFEQHFWIPVNDHSPYVNQKLVRTQGIYKDVLGSTNAEADYMFRPNQCVAMAIAPELFNREHAAIALANIDAGLLTEVVHGDQLGVRTLSEQWPQYRGFYNNSDDSEDSSIAHGFSYHNGPEWLWPLGFALVAKLHFQQCSVPTIMRFVANLKKHISESQWMSLPELTNRGGAFCKDSAPAQAWSISTLLDALLEAPVLAQ